MDEYNKTLKGNGYTMQITNTSGSWGYDILNSKNETILCGDGFNSYEQLINEVSEMHEALSAIFG